MEEKRTYITIDKETIISLPQITEDNYDKKTVEMLVYNLEKENKKMTLKARTITLTNEIALNISGLTKVEKELKDKYNEQIRKIKGLVREFIDTCDKQKKEFTNYELNDEYDTLEFIKELEKQLGKFKIETPITNPDIKRRLMEIVSDKLYVEEQNKIIESNEYKIKKSYIIAAICLIIITIGYVLGMKFALKSIEEANLLLKGLTTLGTISFGAGTAFITHELNKEYSGKIESAKSLNKDKLNSLEVSKNNLLILTSPAQTKAPKGFEYHFNPNEPWDLKMKEKPIQLSTENQGIMLPKYEREQQKQERNSRNSKLSKVYTRGRQ